MLDLATQEQHRLSDDVTVIVVDPVPSPRWFYYGTKRALDLMLAGALLVVLAPLMLLIAVVIKLDSPGPVLFIQERTGSRRRSTPAGPAWEIITFRLYKFRSMVANADPALHQAHIAEFVAGRLEASADPLAPYKLTGDPRITRVGRILRRTSLDELPQLFNVLKGEMSLVGPRPVPTYEAAGYQEPHYQRFAARPGITGLWQVSGRCQLSFKDMIELDCAYVRQQSLLLDAKILLMTIPAIASGRGAG